MVSMILVRRALHLHSGRRRSGERSIQARRAGHAISSRVGELAGGGYDAWSRTHQLGAGGIRVLPRAVCSRCRGHSASSSLECPQRLVIVARESSVGARLFVEPSTPVVGPVTGWIAGALVFGGMRAPWRSPLRRSRRKAGADRDPGCCRREPPIEADRRIETSTNLSD